MKMLPYARRIAASLYLCLLPCVYAQTVPLPDAPQPVAADNRNPNLWHNLQRDWVQERVNLGACKEGLKGISGCGETLLTGTPFHIAVGSLAPQNGIAAGLAFGDVYHPTYCASWLDFTDPPAAGTRNACHWSLNMSAQGSASGNGSWRAGGYVTAARISSHRPVATAGGPQRGLCGVPRLFTRPSPTVGLYSEGDSLNRVYFYGLGPGTLPTGQTVFGLTENVTGIDAVIPISSGWLGDCGVTLQGAVNGRYVATRGGYGQTSPSIETLYTPANAPGIASAEGFVQTEEGVHLIPPFPAAFPLKIDYLTKFQQFVAASDSRYTFRRYTADLNHRLTLYSKDVGKPPRPPLPGSGPMRTIPPIAPTRDVTGSITARLLIEGSVANAGHVVPFYFDPTIGGSDLNGQSLLASYPDYRFRAPNLLLIHGAFEHSLGRVPVGVLLAVDEGKVGLQRNDISFTHLRHSYSAGITLHAGGLPVVNLLFAWGGKEGHHTIVGIDPNLLGVSTRPSLF